MLSLVLSQAAAPSQPGNCPSGHAAIHDFPSLLTKGVAAAQSAALHTGGAVPTGASIAR